MALSENSQNKDALINETLGREKILQLFNKNFADFKKGTMEEKRLILVRFLPNITPLKVKGRNGRSEIYFDYSDLQTQFELVFAEDRIASYEPIKYKSYYLINPEENNPIFKPYADKKLEVQVQVYPLIIEEEAAAVHHERYFYPSITESAIAEIWTAKRKPLVTILDNGSLERRVTAPLSRAGLPVYRGQY